MYKNKKVKIDEFECSEIENYGYCVKGYYSTHGSKLIKYSTIETLNHSNNYIMWSLSKDSINIFTSQIIDVKNSKVISLVRQVKTYRREIEALENYGKE